MCKNNKVCDQCNQTAFIEMVKQPCEHCRKAIIENLDATLLSGNVDNIVLVLTPNESYGHDDAEIFCPLDDLMNATYNTGWDYETYNMETINDAIDYFSCDYGVKFEFSRFADLNTLLPAKKDQVIKICTETEIPFYTGSKQYCSGEFYSRPYDKICEETEFCCWIAMYCYEGIHYSKDYAYFECPDCGRHICEQNPSNGWMGQYVWLGDNQICNKCANESLLEGGIKLFRGDYDEVYAPLFFSYQELKEAGYVEYEGYGIGYGRFGGYRGGEEHIKELVDTLIILDVPVVLNIDSAAIGGMGYNGGIFIKGDIDKVNDLLAEYEMKNLKIAV